LVVFSIAGTAGLIATGRIDVADIEQLLWQAWQQR
jgi:hypothetical protein